MARATFTAIGGRPLVVPSAPRQPTPRRGAALCPFGPLRPFGRRAVVHQLV